MKYVVEISIGYCNERFEFTNSGTAADFAALARSKHIGRRADYGESFKVCMLFDPEDPEEVEEDAETDQ